MNGLDVQITSENTPIGFMDWAVGQFLILDHFSPLASAESHQPPHGFEVTDHAIISSYNKHSPATSIDRGVFISPTWGRQMI